ncbi:MAG TPA: hypothetical protein VHL34_12105 [Rhizomicrobium sp.]|jgi:hypothetical protein|nr:hypothetical protein [Rhizomicrobium sp.]
MTGTTAAPVKYAGRDYMIEMIVVAALYVGLSASRHWIIAHAPTPGLALVGAAVPALPIWGMFWVVWRYYRRIDEFEKQKFLETLALSFGIGSSLVCTWAFLADAGLSQLDITWAFPTLAVTWAIAGGIMHFLRR